MRLFSTTYERLRRQSLDCATKYVPHRKEWLETATMKELYELLDIIGAVCNPELAKQAKVLTEAWREFVEFVGLVQDEAGALRDSIPFARRSLVIEGRVV